MEISFEQFQDLFQIAFSQGNAPDRQQAALNTLYQLKAENPAQFLFFCARIVLEKEVSDVDAFKAIVNINSILKQTRFNSYDMIQEIWMSLPEQIRQELKKALLRGIMFSDQNIINPSASILALIAQIEFPTDWPDFLENLQQVCQFSLLGVVETFICTIAAPKSFKPRHFRSVLLAFNAVITLSQNILQGDVDIALKIKAVNLLSQAVRKKSFGHCFRQNPQVIQTTTALILNHFTVENENLHQELYNFLKYLFQRFLVSTLESPLPEIAQTVARDLSESPEAFRKMAIMFLIKCAQFETAQKDLTQSSFVQTCASTFYGPLLTFLPYLKEINENSVDVKDSLGYCTYRLLRIYAKINLQNEEYMQLIYTFASQNINSQDLRLKCASILALQTYVNIHPFVREFLQPIIQLAMDQNLTVRYYAHSFLTRYIKTEVLNEDPAENVSTIMTIASQLLRSNFKTDGTFGCRMFANFIKQYDSSQINSPISNLDVFQGIIDNLMAKLLQPNVLQSGLDNDIINTLQSLMPRTAYPTIDIRYAFCVQIFEKIKECMAIFMSNQAHQNLQILLKSYIEIYSSIVTTISPKIRGANNPIFDPEITFFLTILDHSSEIPEIFDALASTLLAIPEKIPLFYETIMEYIIKAQQSSQPDLIRTSLCLIGDLFRSHPDIMLPSAPIFINQLLENIESDQYNDEIVHLSLIQLGDIIRNCHNSEVVLPFRDRLMIVLRNIGHYNYDVYDKQQLTTMSLFIEGIILLSGAIIKTFSVDLDFLADGNNQDILFEFRNHINPDVLASSGINVNLILFIKDALSNRVSARKFNTKLNHQNITKTLQSIIQTHPEYSTEARKCLADIRKA